MSDGIRVAAVDDVEPGEALVLDTALTATADAISLFRDDDGTYYALDDTCSHEDASLAEGWIEAGEVECPLHATRFCLADGRPMCLPATKPVRTHRVEVRGEEVYLFPGVPAQVETGQINS
ncbi:non-heme iron oxygenase ferredoxin subunit [Terrabacter aerolatus]|uniref:Putative ferredoxin subunit of phenylpropionate dioxygenase n=1 Tax=Terrabacter aerolatus TaxID=422442 RepID=A0A512D665_9MICO|nr:bifunctional 3-phenylpropionate/cinnamic acid dioxygenase ferredoxin subunit [Terrabacter aerolatus]GEO31974.1 putative ferredoxin subunit of phenylpropionate dioxygenase [Terrabacter aerolatus]